MRTISLTYCYLSRLLTKRLETSSPMNGTEDSTAVYGFDLPGAYDAYGIGLYEYAFTLLQDDRLAADAVRDGLVAAQEHYHRLTEPELLHGWLYAMLRTACMRLGAAGDDTASVGMRPNGEVKPGPDGWTKRDEARLVLLSALAGLPGEQREIIDLFVRHQLTTIELARLLGLPDNAAVDDLTRASAALEEAVAAVVVARTAPQECPQVPVHVGPEPMSGAGVRRLVRHVRSCPECRNRRPLAIATDRLLELLPFAEAPEGLQSEVLLIAIAPDLTATRERIARRTEPLDERGWPYALAVESLLEAERKRSRPAWPVVAVGAGAVVLLVGLATTALSLGGADKQAAGLPSGGAAPGGSSSPSDSSPGSKSASPSKSASASPTAKKTATPTPTPSTAAPPSHHGPPPAGSLAVSGCDMGAAGSCTIRVTAVGGQVQWSVTGTSGPIKAGGGGSLSAGASDTVTVTRNAPLFCIGRQTGTVYFTDGASARISYTC